MASTSNSGRGDAIIEEAARTQIKKNAEPMWKRCCDFGYIIATWEGRLKAVEFLTTVLALICVASTGEGITFYAKFEFFIFVGTTCWVFVCLHIVLRMTHIYEKLPLILISTLTRAICCAVAVLFLLISSSIVIADTGLASLLAGGAFGYISMFLFFFEGLYSFMQHRKGVSEAKRMENMRKTNDEEILDPVSAPY